MQKKTLSRRAFLRLSAMSAVSALAASCAQATPVVVEKEVPVEKIVVVTATAVPATATPALSAEEQWRRETLIFPFANPIGNPELANPLVPGYGTEGYRMGVGFEFLWLTEFESRQHLPWLAAVPSTECGWNKDFTRVDIPLREGIEWSDGMPFTAEDVVFSLNMVMNNPGLKSGTRMADAVASVEALDNLTVRINLKYSYPRFLDTLMAGRGCQTPFHPLPKHVWETVEDPTTFTNFDLEKGWPIWTGPYMVVEATESRRIFELREDWWGAKTGFQPLPKVKRVAWTQVGGAEAQVAKLENNEIDFGGPFPLNTFLTLKARRPDLITWTNDPPYSWMDPCPYNLGPNCQREPWNDPEMRWALAYALDHEKLSNIVQSGFGIPAKVTWAPYVQQKYYDAIEDLTTKYDVTVYDPERSKQIIESKGWEMGADGIYAKDGKRLQAEMIASISGVSAAQPTLIASMLRDVGIDCQPKIMAHAAYRDRKAAGEFDLECSTTVCGSQLDPYMEMFQWHSKFVKPEGERRSYNQWGYVNPEYDALIDQWEITQPGSPQDMALCRQVMEIWLRDLPVITIDQSPRILVQNPTYWVNWPTRDENPYVSPHYWCSEGEILYVNLEPRYP